MMSQLPNREEKLSLDTFVRGLWEENPVFVMLLGMCPVLAVTNSTMNAISTLPMWTSRSACTPLIPTLLPKWNG